MSDPFPPAGLSTPFFDPTGIPGPPGPAGSTLAFPSPAALAAFDASGLSNFAVVSVGVLNDAFQLQRAPTPAVLAAVDGDTVIAAAAPAGAVWTRCYVVNLPAAYEAAWFVDPVAGNDAAAGTTALTPLKTFRELTARLRGNTLNQNTLVTVAAGTTDTLRLTRVTVGVGAVLTIQCAVTSSAPAALTGAVATVPATATRGQIVDAVTGAFAVNQRIRMTSGAASTALAYVTGLNGGPTDAYVSRWAKPTAVPNNVTIGSEPTVGDTYVVDTLQTTIPAIEIQWDGGGSVLVRDAVVTGVNRFQRTYGSSTSFYGCRFTGTQTFIGNAWNFVSCAFEGAHTFTSACVALMRATYHAAAATVQASSSVQWIAASAWRDGASTTASTLSFIAFSGTDHQWVELTTFAIALTFSGASGQQAAGTVLWGANNVIPTVTISTAPSTAFVYGSNKPAIPGAPAGQDCRIGGTFKAYAAIPFANTANQSALVLNA